MSDSIFLGFGDKEECYISYCKYLAKQFNWCMLNQLWTLFLEPDTSAIDQECFIRNIPDPMNCFDTYKCFILNCLYFQEFSNGEVNFSQDCFPFILHGSGRIQIILHQEQSWFRNLFFLHMSVAYQIKL